eukprot:8818537-Prorocentrum_lima.AAC.1
MEATAVQQIMVRECELAVLAPLSNEDASYADAKMCVRAMVNACCRTDCMPRHHLERPLRNTLALLDAAVVPLFT